RLPEDQRAVWAKGPMIIEKTGDVGLYLVPPMEGRGFKVGDHEFSRNGDPDAGREVTEDERFVVEKAGSKGWVLSPCSGHGFKFGALMGLELARTIASNRDPLQH